MPSKRIIKISSVTRDKKGRYLIEAGSLSFLINENSFTDGFYYVGKELNENDVASLKEESSICLLLDYAFSLLSKKSYSVSETEEKLFRKTPNKKAVLAVITHLKQYGLLDDETFAKNYKESRENALYGKNAILDELRFKKGISPEILESLSFQNEEEHATSFLLRLSRILESYPNKIRREKARNALLRHGYDSSVINDALASLLEENKTKVRAKLDKDARRAHTRYNQKYSGYELISHLRVFLLRKGYESDDINDAIRRIQDECH